MLSGNSSPDPRDALHRVMKMHDGATQSIERAMAVARASLEAVIGVTAALPSPDDREIALRAMCSVNAGMAFDIARKCVCEASLLASTGRVAECITLLRSLHASMLVWSQSHDDSEFVLPVLSQSRPSDDEANPDPPADLDIEIG